MRYASRLFMTTLAATTILTGCGSDDDKIPLPGQRISVLELQRNLEPVDTQLQNIGFIAPDEWNNAFWPQAGGYPNHDMQHVALNHGPLKKIWESSIGEGDQDGFPLIAQPIVFNNVVFTLDTESEVSAFNLKTGKKIWSRSVQPKKEDETVVSGGIAFSSGRLFVTNGYDELIALDPAKGDIAWKAKLTAPSRAAPSILNDKVYVVTLENKLIAFNAADGQQLWDYQGLSELSSIVGSASPAVNNELVIPVFTSGEIIALRVENGSVAWNDDLSPTVRVGGLGALPDIKALPVIDKDLIFAVSFSGKMVAIDHTTGQRVWEKEIGGTEMPWVAGNMIFMITTNNELLALSRDTGAIAWVKPLAGYIKEDAGRQGLLWSGPVLAGGRLILTGPEGNLLEVDPANGNPIRRMKLGETVTLTPVVASGVLLLLTEKGTLQAYQ